LFRPRFYSKRKFHPVCDPFGATDGELTIAMGQEDPLRLSAKAALKDRKMVRVEPVDPATYSTMVQRSK
jgi:hypothetical protein